MPTFDALVESQIATAKIIEAIVRNYKKDSQDRKTLDYLNERRTRADIQWDSFEKNHQAMEVMKDNNAGNDYYKKGYYENVKQVYHSFLNTIDEQISNTKAEMGASANIDTETDVNIQLDAQQQRRIRKQKSTMGALERLLQTAEGKLPQATTTYCSQLLVTLQKYWDDVATLHSAISEEENLGDYNLVFYSELEIHYLDVITQLQARIQEFLPLQAPQISVNLPKINLPQFDGSYLKWPQFRDLFMELIHNQQISNTQKMLYLKQNLHGESKRLIQHLPVSEENYDISWQLIENRYNNKKMICSSFLEKLLTQPTVTESASSIKSLHDTTTECLAGLHAMKIEIDHWDPILHHVLVKKLDRNTHESYEQQIKNPKELPKVLDLLEFLEHRFQSLESFGRKKEPIVAKRAYEPKSSFISSQETKLKCGYCAKSNHTIYNCTEFQNLQPEKRLEQTRRSKLCLNCLRPGHTYQSCTSKTCFKCKKKHHTLLHLGRDPDTVSTSITTPRSALTSAAETKKNTSYVFLGTAKVTTTDFKGDHNEVRAMLDSGSQLNFISMQLYKKLGLKSQLEEVLINGIGTVKTKSHHRVSLEIKSRMNNYTVRFEAIVLPKITNSQPSCYINKDAWPIPKNIQLADPNFNQPSGVDNLVGAEVYPDLVKIGQIKLNKNLPTLQNTHLGWVVMGKASSCNSESSAWCGISTLETQLQKFWIMEETESAKKPLTFVERKCEHYFLETVRKKECNRFVVRLPFLQDRSTLGNSRQLATQRFFSLERRLVKNPELMKEYSKFIDEYLQLGHMEQLDEKDIPKSHYFLPHHCVIKPESTTTKLRVVFDGSAKTSSNLSLNDILMKGPTIQDDLFSILLRFRLHKYVFTSDVAKMYRQVKMADEDKNMQLIIWRDKPTEKLQYFRLSTVTYGTTSASYLATKCLHQVAEDERNRYPLASVVAKRDFYVDDVMSGSNSLEDAIEIQSQLISMLSNVGFKLRKWCANNKMLLKSIPSEDKEIEFPITDSEADILVKTLGITWNPNKDVFTIKTNWPEQKRITKRTILSDVAHVFDPLGFVNPVIVLAKIFLQELWALKLDWDESLPQVLHTKWSKFRTQLKLLNDLDLPRLAVHPNSAIELHGFSDVSERAFGACIYLGSKNEDGSYTVRLLCAKSKVAPIKQQTIARLELCSAKMLAVLINRVKNSLNLNIQEIFCWTDSMIVLSWIAASTSTMNTFVANRVARIQELTLAHQWRHVESENNAADIISRGLFPEEIMKSELWFNGPSFLQKTKSEWPSSLYQLPEIIEQRKQKTVLIGLKDDLHVIATIDHRNSFKVLQRVVGFILRFSTNSKVSRSQQEQRELSKALSTKELEEALRIIIKYMQPADFTEEIADLKSKQQVKAKSKLTSLSPFLDEHEIIRVGGRLVSSSLPYNAKHPIVLPSKHEFTRLLIYQHHLDNLHAGPQALLSIVRQRFWPLHGKKLAQSTVHYCIRCFRSRPKLISQMMGNLPLERIEPSRPFINVGVDFCGPVMIHYHLRGKRPTKAYIAVFVCFSTKAVHMEIVSDLSTAAFIGSLKRFMARRGKPAKIFCDNATNFTGARAELKEIEEIICRNNSKIENMCGQAGTQWCPIPARSPHFGGLWEAAVKSAKFHMKRVIQNSALSYEELNTVITQIEAVLNSRPLTPLSSSPDDLQVLTPGHFLIGEPLTTVAEECPSGNISLLTRWKLVKSIQHEFWRRWKHEYLQELQQRCKWTKPQQDLKIGTLVLLKDDNLPILQWRMGRVTKAIKGGDNLVRVVDVKTSTGELRRAIHQVCPLPMMHDQSESVKEINALPKASSKHSMETRSKSVPAVKSASKQPVEKGQNCSTTSLVTSSNISTTKKQSRNTSKMPIGYLLFLLFLLAPVFASPIKPSLEIQKFESQPGIFFENIGKLNFYTNEWNLVVYFNMENYWQEIYGFRKNIDQLRDLCLQSEENDNCKEIYEEFKHHLNQIEHNNEILLTRNGLSRQKRSPFDFVGYLGNKLFGVLDQDYAAKIGEAIEDIKGNENNLRQLLRNQTSIIESTTNIIKKDQANIYNQFQNLEKYIHNMTDQLNNMTDRLRQQKTDKLFLQVSMHTSLIMSGYQRVQTALLDILMDSHHGKINNLVITPDQLKAELNKIRMHIPNALKVPGQNDNDNLLKLYHLMNALFNIKIPLITTEDFDIFKPVSVPALINGTFVSIVPSENFFVSNLHRDLFYAMLENELTECTLFEPGHFLCKQKHPIFNENMNISRCEIGFFQHKEEPLDCFFKYSPPTKYWFQLFQPNHWIYSLDKEYTLNIVCGEISSQRLIRGTGLLEIKGNCVIKQDSMTISSHNVFPTQLRTSFLPSTNIKSLKPPAKFHKLSQLATHYQPSLEEINKLHEQVRELATNERSAIASSPHHIHHYTIGYISLTLILLCIGTLIIIKIRKRKGPILISTPKAAPRTSKPTTKFTASDFELNIEHQSI